MQWMKGWSWPEYLACPDHVREEVILPMMRAEVEAAQRKAQPATGMMMPPAETTEDIMRIIEAKRKAAQEMDEMMAVAVKE